jgi:TFIIH basal transcription factor complex TTD-A subunit
MPRAIRGTPSISLVISRTTNRTNIYALPGVLVECDPSIKSIIVKIDSEKNDFIVEELDDQTLVIKEGMLHILKMRLDEVDFSFSISLDIPFPASFSQMLPSMCVFCAYVVYDQRR